MELITFCPSRNWKLNHLIFLEEINPKSYAGSILLKDYYQSLENNQIGPSIWQTDWRYYFIVRRLWLRKNRVKLNGDKFWVCHYCGRHIHKMPIRNKNHQNLHECVTVDHKIPKSDGIDILDTNNFLVSCYDCNSKKKSTSYENFINGKVLKKKMKNRKNKQRPCNPDIFKKDKKAA